MFFGCLIVSLGTVFAVEEGSVCGFIARNFDVDSSIDGVLLQAPINNPEPINIIRFTFFIFLFIIKIVTDIRPKGIRHRHSSAGHYFLN